jgi:hypothetical protein
MVYYAPGTPEWEEQQKQQAGGFNITSFSQPQQENIVDPVPVAQPTAPMVPQTNYSPIFQDADVQKQENLTGFEGISSAIKGFDPSLTAGQVNFETRNLAGDANYLNQASIAQQQKDAAAKAAKVTIPTPVLAEQPKEQKPAAPKVETPNLSAAIPVVQPLTPTVPAPVAPQPAPVAQPAARPVQQPTGFEQVQQAISQPMVPGTTTPAKVGVEGQTPAMAREFQRRLEVGKQETARKAAITGNIQDYFKQRDTEIRAQQFDDPRQKQQVINELTAWYNDARKRADAGQEIPQPPKQKIAPRQEAPKSAMSNEALAAAYKSFGGKFGGVLSKGEILAEMNKNPVFRDQVLAEMGGNENYTPPVQQPSQVQFQSFEPVRQAIQQPRPRPAPQPAPQPAPRPVQQAAAPVSPPVQKPVQRQTTSNDLMNQYRQKANEFRSRQFDSPEQKQQAFNEINDWFRDARQKEESGEEPKAAEKQQVQLAVMPQENAPEAMPQESFEQVKQNIVKPQAPTFFTQALDTSIQKLNEFGDVKTRVQEMIAGVGANSDTIGGLDYKEQEDLYEISEHIAKAKLASKQLYTSESQFNKDWKKEKEDIFLQLMDATKDLQNKNLENIQLDRFNQTVTDAKRAQAEQQAYRTQQAELGRKNKALADAQANAYQARRQQGLDRIAAQQVEDQKRQAEIDKARAQAVVDNRNILAAKEKAGQKRSDAYDRLQDNIAKNKFEQDKRYYAQKAEYDRRKAEYDRQKEEYYRQKSYGNSNLQQQSQSSFNRVLQSILGL